MFSTYELLSIALSHTRKYPLRGYCLVPLEGRGDQIFKCYVTLRCVTLRDVTLRDVTLRIRTSRQRDVEVEILFQMTKIYTAIRRRQEPVHMSIINEFCYQFEDLNPPYYKQKQVLIFRHVFRNQRTTMTNRYPKSKVWLNKIAFFSLTEYLSEL